MTSGASPAAAETRSAGDIAIVGMAGRFPGAPDVEAFWRNLRTGVESIETMTDDDLAAEGVAEELYRREEYVRAAPVLEDIELFDARFFGFTAREAALLDPQQRLFLECAWHAMENAALDPGRCGTTGVFAGAGMSAYLMSNLLGGNRIMLDSASFELQIHNDKDYLASRTAYKLGLSGPAVSVQTACSTSLVAVHQAAQSLLAGGCEVAIAGGVCVRVPHRVGYRYEQGLIYSPDGHCRPFSAESAGTVFGNGVGAVVLKRLSDAERDRDRVLAVLKGSAVNNDGADKVGYTSPSAAGQEDVIATALAAAGVPARTITAVEAHGTGTPIGDPIEVSALTRAFARSTTDTGFCAISSVKSNIGHLESAAGIASLIKAVLQLRHRELAPSLHCGEPNPRIDFAATPFYVNTALAEWPAGATPRRIGVSSFGIGGTNAHVILEEAGVPVPSSPCDRPQLVLLSAKAPEALDAATGRLAEHLGRPGTPPLADVAHTLRAGRAPMRYRRVVLAEDTTGAVRALEGTDAAGTRSADSGVGGARLVFLFPGQGTQYPGMGRDLYRDEPVFTAAVDECAELLGEQLGVDLRRVLYPADAVSDGLTSTELAQPALFVTEYALAKVLENWGVVPEAMVGHSIGEFTAACLAGVLSLPDALRMVATRGRLMRELPPGAMLSVAASEDQVREMTGPEIDIAAVNAPSLCVLSGPAPAITKVASVLTERGISTRPLHTSHAFHSSMMDPVVGPITETARTLHLTAPARRFVSGVSGDWITPEQATDPRYWGAHLREPVRFGDAVRTAAGPGPVVLVEVGPGNTLSTLARAAEPGPGTRVSTVATMRRPDDERDDTRVLLSAVGDVWLFGGSVDWTAFERDRRSLVELPGYPFQRERFWIGPSGSATTGMATLAVPEEIVGEEPAPLSNRPGTLLSAYAEPRDDTERQVTEVWQEFFGITPIGIQDNFFELGGHSLLATQILNRLRERVGATIALSTLLSSPTVAGTAAALRAEQPNTDTFAELVPRPEARTEPFPLNEMQQAQWIGRLANFDMGGVSPHLYHEFDSDTLELARLERAWQRVVHRHDMLRMVVLPDGRQRILTDVAPYRFTVLDLREADARESAAKLAEVREHMSTEVLRADTWPLWEIRVSLLDAHRIRVHISFDLLVADVACFFYQILPQWRDFYHEPDYDPAPLSLSFRDYVLAEEQLRQSPQYERSLEYWRTRVRELPTAPELPTVTPSAALVRPAFVRRHARLDPELWGRIKARAGEYGVTPSSALLAAFAVTIATWSKNQRFTLNFTAVNRLPVHSEVDDLVGEFASFDLLEVDAITPSTFAELVKQLQQQSWEDFEHRLVSGVRILRERARARGSSTSDVMPVVFTSALSGDVDGKPAPSPVDWLGEQAYFISQTPQVTIDHFLLEFEGNLELAWHAVDELFPEGLMAEMFEAYQGFVRGLAEEEGWSRPPLLPLPGWQRESRDAANDTKGPLPGGLLVSRVFEHAGSEADALITAERTLSFAELTGRAVRLAEELTAAGLGRGSVVGVGLAKGWRQVVAVMGISAAGSTYVPLDPELPEPRRRWLVEQAGVDCVVTEADAGDHWPGAPRTLSVAEDTGRQKVWRGADASAWRCPAEPDDVAYVIYTSGSTGNPKGVAVSHRAALNTLVDINERFEVGGADRVLALSSLSFDLSVYDLFGVLGAGAAVVLPEPAARRDPGRWLELIHEHRVTVWNSVPALMQMLVEHAEAGWAAGLATLRVALLSGDWIPLWLPDRLRSCVPDLAVVSLGGATEAAVWSICYPIGEVQPNWPSIPYGRPLRNQTFHVLNDRLLPAPVWVPGQLFIGGTGVADCYWHDEQRTAESFITHPDTGERLYRTGDLGRYLPDGTLEFLGRDDFQVKIGGFRIELGEIEHALRLHPSVADAVASAVGPRTQQRLVAHVVAQDDTADPVELVAALRAHLSATVPSYLIPADFLIIDAIPLSSNGKVDRSALPDPLRPTSGGSGESQDGTIVAKLLVLAADVLSVVDPGAADNFFELGGDSILGVQFVGRANAEGIAVTAQDLFESDTFAGLAAAAVAGGDTEAEEPTEGVPLTPHQAATVGTTGWVAIEVAGRLDATLAERALRLLAERHTALRLRIRPNPDADGSPLAHAVRDEEHVVAEIDLRRLTGQAQHDAVTEICEEIAAELDPAAGPVLKLAVVRVGDQDDRLVWVIARGLLDDASFALLRGEFDHVYRRLAEDRPVFWDSTAGCALEWGRTLDRPLTHPAGLEGPRTDRGGGEEIHRLRLDPARTREFADAVAGAYHLDLGQACVAALALSLRVVVRQLTPQLLVERSVRGEEWATGGPVAGRLTELVAVEPVPDTDAAAALTAIKDRIRTDISPDAAAATVTVGEFVDWDAIGDTGLTSWPADFAGLDGVADRHIGSLGRVTAGSVAGELRVDWRLGPGLGSGVAGRWVEAFADAVRTLGEHCRALGSASYEPADFPLSGLSGDELTEFLGELT
ncbi:amino acid adenylation domain-containing protein [Amycolatopsis azurea]|uniref:amino acid adenylation domain-containing protein n=1 Tax=Amycolatopsis azurea TaxID=36819 RepID=UPI0037FF1A6E